MQVFQWAIMEADLDTVAGAEQKGTRPVLVVSNEEFIMAHQIRTISKQRLRGLIGYLEGSQLREEVCMAIKEHLDIE